jgi:hypothetical protein
MWTKLFAAIGGGAVIASALVVAVTADPGQAVAGSGNGRGTMPTQPTVPALTFGATVTAGPAATTLTTSLASPTAKATQLGSECSMPGVCP